MHTIIISAVSRVGRPDVDVGGSGVGQAGVVSGVNARWQISVWTSERGPRPQQRQDGDGPRHLHRNRRSHHCDLAHNNMIIASRVFGGRNPEDRMWIRRST